MSPLAFHPLAEIFPLIEGQEFAELVEDIRHNGLIEPIVVYDGQVLDGRNRYRACIDAGVEPTFVPFRGDDPVAFVISMNLKRRHLDESQRAMVAAKLASLQDGQRSDLVQSTSIEGAAKLLNVGRASVERAKVVQRDGTPELQRAHGRVKAAWGFECVTNIVWVKDKIGLGFWIRSQQETLLIARRGDIPTPLPANRPPSVIISPRREHSRKPDEAYELIERMYPELPKIELFARGGRPGWSAWGNQAADVA